MICLVLPLDERLSVTLSAQVDHLETYTPPFVRLRREHAGISRPWAHIRHTIYFRISSHYLHADVPSLYHCTCFEYCGCATYMGLLVALECVGRHAKALSVSALLY